MNALGRKLTGLVLALAVLAAPGRATWSIVAVDTKTGEVSIAAATCLADFDLERWLPVMRVGEGGGVAQGLIDFGAPNRLKIWNGLIAGDTAHEIVFTIVTESSVNARQFGVATLTGDAAAWSGPSLGAAAFDLQGQAGSVVYTIQGNVLSGENVVAAAEEALLLTSGDLSQRVMAAMEAARDLGGDGRCSCTGSPPCEPPPGFAKSAHVAFIVQSRIGDVDGTCGHALGCATGDYYLDLQVSGDVDDPDPVTELRVLYDAWRAALAGHPDGVLSTAVPAAPRLVADGVTETVVTVRLRDVDGVPLAAGGAQIDVVPLVPAPPASAGPVTDHGDGSYSFALTAGTQPGTGVWRITADDGTVAAVLQPDLVVAVDPLAPLHAGATAVSASAGAHVPFVLNAGAESAGDVYLVAGTTSGTFPGLDLGTDVLPLNPDPFTSAAHAAAGGPLFPGAFGILDGSGRAEAAFAPGPGLLTSLVGLRIDWAAVLFPPPLAATNAVGFDVHP